MSEINQKTSDQQPMEAAISNTNLSLEKENQVLVSDHPTEKRPCDPFLEKLAAGRIDEVKTLIFDTIMSACRNELELDEIITMFSELVEKSPEAATLIADMLGLIELEIDGGTQPNARDIFLDIVRGCGSFMSLILMERIENELLVESGLVSNTSAKQKVPFNTRMIRVKTKMFYKQQKFNLLREESEGYSKLLAEVCQPTSESDPLNVVRVIQCLIGRFNLDPNRVADIILQAFQCQPNCNFFIALLQKLNLPSLTICELLGSRLTSEEYRASLYVLIAHLLQHLVITLEEIYPWLTPDDRIIHRQWARELQDAKEYARKSMIVSINKEKEEEEADGILPSDDLFFDNQKFCLCEALVSVGAWDEAMKLMKRFPEYCCVSQRRIACRVIDFLDYLIRPIYKRVTKTSSRKEPTGHLSSTNSRLQVQFQNYADIQDNYQYFRQLGPYIHFNPLLAYKILRIMTYFLERIPKMARKSKLYYQQLTILDEVLLPGLCFLESNCSLAEEIWGLLKLYPYEHRYRLYSSWKGETTVLLHPSLLRKRVDLVKNVKHLMKRISKENVKPMGRLLGKLSHSMPAVVFDYLLSQIQLFDNLTMPVIDALKFSTSLSFDVLGYCLLEALAPGNTRNMEGLSVMLMPNRPRTKHDGSTISPWLQSLAVFTGAICKKYPLELVPLLQYVANQLKSKQSLDLLLLKEIVQKMTGIEAAEDMTALQLDALGGGELLRAEAGYFGQVRTAKKSATRLREASSVNDLAVTLCILMAQQRDCIIFNESSNLHTKLVGKLYDECQDTLVQFGTFLANSCTLDDYARKIPPLKSLVEEYHVSSDVAYFLWRPLFAHAIQTKYEDLRKAEKHKLTSVQRNQKYVEAANEILSPVADVMRTHLPMKTWDDISPQFYVTFWSLSLYDLFVPTEAYAREVNRIKGLAAAAAENKELPSNKRKKEQERCTTLIEKLHEERKRQKEHVERVMSKLNKEKDSWFASRTAKSAKNEAVTAFLQLCLFPRCIFTAPDALYCAHFVNTIHSLSTPNFSTLICYDRIFCDIIYTVTLCSENEANRYGRFLCALLGTVMKWHGDKAVFDKECASFPGFITKFRAGNASVTESNDHVEYENYRHVCHKWHYKITKSVIVCLESKDFTQIRNSLIVLMRILPHYPRVLNLANAVERWIERVRSEQKDKRQDLFALATSYIGQLKSRWGSVVLEEDFHMKSTPAEKQPDASKPSKTPPSKSVNTPPPPKNDESKSAKSTETKIIKTEKQDKSVDKGRTESKLNIDATKEAKPEAKLPKSVDKVDRASESRKSKLIRAPEPKLQKDDLKASSEPKLSSSSDRSSETKKSRGSDSQESPRSSGLAEARRARPERSPPPREAREEGSPSRKSKKKKPEDRSHTRSHK